MIAWWKRRSRRTKGRLVFYPAFVGIIVGSVCFTTCMPGTTFSGDLPRLDDDGRRLADDLRKDVSALVGPGERNLDTPGSMERSETFLKSAFEAAGLAPKRLPYTAGGKEVANIEATVPGGKAIVVVGAHYDTANTAPGADDNASGVAALLALARKWAHAKPHKTLRFVAFTNEEPPHFWRETMGSLVYAKACRAANDDIVAMLSLESIGFYNSEPGSQKYPPIVRMLYPDRGDFIAFVGNVSSRSLVRDSIRVFRDRARFPSQGAAMPSFIEGVGWSDQWSFWQVGYRGVMITDTAVFRNPHYHTPTDSPDTLDYDRLAMVTLGVNEVVTKLVK
jgi:peptidase M28-like protein